MTGIEKQRYSSFLGNLTITRRALEARGIDTKGLFRDIGLNISDYDNDRFKRVPVNKSNKFFKEAVRRSGDPCFGLRVADHINPASYQQFGVGLLYSANLRDFLSRYARLSSFMTTLYDINFVDQFTNVELSLVPLVKLSQETAQFDADAFVAAVLKFIRIAYRPGYSPKSVNISWLPPNELRGQYSKVFGCEVDFGANVTSIEFDYFDLDKPFPASNKELAREHDNVVVEFLAKAAKIDLRYQVYSKLIELLPSGACNRDSVAQALNMSTGTFHSKLKKEGTNFQELLDETRYSLAESYVSRNDISLTEIAYLLGYTNSSNFSRAFKSWTGETPRAYRLKACT